MKKKYIYGLIIFVIFMIVFLILNIKLYKSDEIGSIAFNINKNDYRIYIKENDKYVSYLVLDNDYANSGNTLVMRENILGGETYIYDYNGSIYKEKIYDKSFLMNQHCNYDETEVDNFLTNDFIKYFDNKFLSFIINTELNIADVIDNDRYKIERKFFILSLGELNIDNVNEKDDNYSLKYFENNNLIAKNDFNVPVNYWTRSYGWLSYDAIGSTGKEIGLTGSEAKYGIRPVFTISSNTKIIKKYIKEINKDVFVIDY